MRAVQAAQPRAPVILRPTDTRFNGELTLSQPNDLFVARRYGWRVILARRHFEVLTALLDAGDDMVSASKLMDGRTGRDGLNTLIHRLREQLAELHVGIECRQRHGYRLILHPVSERIAANSYLIGGSVA